MSTLNILLFGKFSARVNEQTVDGLDSCKVQELFCYLLLHRNRPHPRETLAGLLWSDSRTAQSKKYLRQTLWQLQTAFDSLLDKKSRLLLVDSDWVQVNPHADLWIDVATFEQNFALAQSRSSPEADNDKVRALQNAIHLYRGDLLEGCYQDWCLYKREQLQSTYLSILHKLMICCEARQEYEAGVTYGKLILSYDCAREQTHRRLMRLFYLAGDRTEALRQYERCTLALKRELSVGPSRRTRALYEQIRADRLDEQAPTINATALMKNTPTLFAPALLSEFLDRLKLLQQSLTEIQRQIQQGIKASELTIKNRR